MSNQEEFVLALPRRVFDPTTYSGDYSKFTDLIDNKSEFLLRSIAETNEDYLQIIPYVIISYKDKNNEEYIFTYQRLKAGTENRLHGLYSVGIGGHIERSKDFRMDSGNLDALRNGIIREIKEEVNIDDPARANLKLLNYNKFIIYDDSNAVGRVHVGILYKYNSPTIDIKPREINKISGTMVSINKIRNSDKMEFENWSKEALRCI